jgi:hypothetical protein
MDRQRISAPGRAVVLMWESNGGAGERRSVAHHLVPLRLGALATAGASATRFDRSLGREIMCGGAWFRLAAHQPVSSPTPRVVPVSLRDRHRILFLSVRRFPWRQGGRETTYLARDHGAATEDT